MNATPSLQSPTAPARLVDSIRNGDKVTISVHAGIGRFGPETKLSTGVAVMRGTYGWVLNMGGRYGTPGVATDANTVSVKHARRAA